MVSAYHTALEPTFMVISKGSQLLAARRKLRSVVELKAWWLIISLPGVFQFSSEDAISWLCFLQSGGGWTWSRVAYYVWDLLLARRSCTGGQIGIQRVPRISNSLPPYHSRRWKELPVLITYSRRTIKFESARDLVLWELEWPSKSICSWRIPGESALSPANWLYPYRESSYLWAQA